MNLVKTLDQVFSQYIRLKYADVNGYCRCFTCGDVVYWKTIDCGHFVRRMNMATRWHEDNCRPQCFTCNRLKHGNMIVFRGKLSMMLGCEEVVMELEKLGQSEMKFTETELKEKIAYYRTKVRELKKIKDCSRLF